MPFDPAHRSELYDAIEYELFAIDEFRSRVHFHYDTEASPHRHVLGERAADGTVLIHSMIAARSINCEGPIRAALDPLRPLLFGAAFKPQDLAVEWLLRVNVASAPSGHWPLRDKQSALRNATVLPPELQGLATVWSAFVETYVRLVEARNVLVHRKGVRVHRNGDVELATKPNSTTLTNAAQAAYARAISFIASAMGGQRTLGARERIRLESDFAELEPLHGVTGLQRREPRQMLLTIDVPSACIQSTRPLECIVDFVEVSEVWRRLEELYEKWAVVGEIWVRPVGSNVEWRFDAENLPTGNAVSLKEGDPAFDSYLHRAAE